MTTIDVLGEIPQSTFFPDEIAAFANGGRPIGRRGGRLVTSSDDYSDLMAAVAQDRDRAAFERLFDHFAPRLNS